MRDIVRGPGGTGDQRWSPVSPLPAVEARTPQLVPPLLRVTSASPTAPTAAPATITGAPPPTIANSIIHSVVPDKVYLSPFDPPNPPPPVPWRQTARKPGSVPPTAWPPRVGMAIPLGRPLPGASCDRPERRREGPPGIPGIAPRCLPLLLGLAPGGVCRAAAVAGGAVRPYRTVSPLPPVRYAGTGLAVYFLWHFPWGRPRRALPGTAPPWSPDFPLPAARGERPSGRLATKDLGIAAALSNRRLPGGREKALADPDCCDKCSLDDVELQPARPSARIGVVADPMLIPREACRPRPRPRSRA